MSQARKNLAGSSTAADLFAIPEDARFHELVEGEILPKEAATGEHGDAQAGLAELLRRPFHRRPGGRWPGGWWILTEVEVLVDPTNVLRPDVVGWRRERMAERPTGSPIAVVPDWVCEILSTNRRHDLVRKKRVYHGAHVPYYWVVDPSEQTLSVHRFSPDGYVEILSAERGERVRAQPFEAIEIQVGVFFGDEPDD